MESWGFTLYLAQLAFVLSMGSQWGITLLSYNTRFILRASSDFVDLSDDLHFVEIIVRADFPNKQLIKKNRVLQGWFISCNNVLETTMVFIIYTLDVFWEQNSPVTSLSDTVHHVLPLLVLPVWSRDIFSEVDEVEFVRSGFDQREEQQVEGEDRVVSTDLFIFLLFQTRKITLKLLLSFFFVIVFNAL